MTEFSTSYPSADGMYDPKFEHDACGVAMVARLDNEPSHEIVSNGLLALENLEHRGAAGADASTGDGAGILIQMPDDFYRVQMAAQGVTLPPPGEYGVGMIFLPKENACSSGRTSTSTCPRPASTASPCASFPATKPAASCSRS